MKFRVMRSNGPAMGLIVEAPRWWEARVVALMHYGCEVSELRFRPTNLRPHVKVRWSVLRGAPDRMQFCTRGDEWSDEYVASGH